MLAKKSIPNLLTGLRLCLVPVLWAFALLGHAVVVGAGMAFAWLTDALDGYLARRWKAQSEWGSRFDSIADLLMFVSGLGWIVLLRPAFVREHAVVLLVWVALGAAAYLVSWFRFRRFADVHLYSAKAANFVGFWFVAWLLAFEAYPPALFYLVIGVCLVAALETLLAVSTRDRVDEHLITIFRPRRRAGSPPQRPAPPSGRVNR
jgi:cardiolipin synthase (CMP-forming)